MSKRTLFELFLGLAVCLSYYAGRVQEHRHWLSVLERQQLLLGQRETDHGIEYIFAKPLLPTFPGEPGYQAP